MPHCPADHHPLKSTHIHSRNGHYAIVLLCEHCGGALLDEPAQAVLFANVLKTDPTATLEGHRCCPRDQSTMRQVPLGRVVLDYCKTCQSLWFDSGKLAVLYQMVQAEQMAHLPNLTARCLDCGQRSASLTQSLDAGVGLICPSCLRRPPNNATLSYRNATVHIQHHSDSAHYTGSVEIRLPFANHIQARLTTPGFWQRMLRLFGQRCPSLGRPNLDQLLWVETEQTNALQSFLNNHGVGELLGEISMLADHCELVLTEHSFTLTLRNWIPNPADQLYKPQTRLESMARRLCDRLYLHHNQDAIADGPWA